MTDSSSQVSAEDYRYVLTSQRDIYRHIQSQAQRILRTLLASVAVIVAFAGSNLYTTAKDTVAGLSIPEVSVETAGGQLTLSPSLFEQIASTSQITAGVFSVVAGLLLLDCGIQAFRVLREDLISPAVPDSDSVYEGYRSSKNERHRDWIQHNRSVLAAMQTYLRNSYNRILEASIALFVAFLLFSGIYMGLGDLLAVVSVLVVASPLIVVLNYIVALPVYHYVSSEEPKKEIFQSYSDGFSLVSKRMPSIVPGYLVVTGYLIAMATSAYCAVFWYLAVWLPQLKYEFPVLF